MPLSGRLDSHPPMWDVPARLRCRLFILCGLEGEWRRRRLAVSGAPVEELNGGRANDR